MQDDNRIWWLLCTLLAGMGIVLTAALITPTPDGAAGQPHPDFQAMLQGGSPARHDNVLWAGWCFGLLQLGVFSTVLAIGLRPAPAGRIIVTIGAIHAASFVMVLIAYQAGWTQLVLSFPPATAWMLYGVWPLQSLFALLYIVKFRDWVVTPETATRFAALLEARRSLVAEVETPVSTEPDDHAG